MKTFFLEITCFWREKLLEFLISAGKTLRISVKIFFLLRSPKFDKKQPQSRLKLMKIWVKFVSGCIKLPKQPPPPLRNPGYAPALVKPITEMFAYLRSTELVCGCELINQHSILRNQNLLKITPKLYSPSGNIGIKCTDGLIKSADRAKHCGMLLA